MYLAKAAETGAALALAERLAPRATCARATGRRLKQGRASARWLGCGNKKCLATIWTSFCISEIRANEKFRFSYLYVTWKHTPATPLGAHSGSLGFLANLVTRAVAEQKSGTKARFHGSLDPKVGEAMKWRSSGLCSDCERVVSLQNTGKCIDV